MNEFEQKYNFGRLVALERRVSVDEARIWWAKVVDRKNFPTHAYQFFRGLISYEDLFEKHKELPEGIKICLCRVGINPDAWRGEGMDQSVQAEIYLSDEINNKIAPSSRDGDGLHKKVPGSEKLLAIRSGVALVRPRTIYVPQLRVIEKRNPGSIAPELHSSLVVALDEKPSDEVRDGLERYHGCLVIHPLGL